ncbi:unnamed protein product [Sympodiomycopsis kandeliae]
MQVARALVGGPALTASLGSENIRSFNTRRVGNESNTIWTRVRRSPFNNQIYIKGKTFKGDCLVSASPFHFFAHDALGGLAMSSRDWQGLQHRRVQRHASPQLLAGLGRAHNQPISPSESSLRSSVRSSKTSGSAASTSNQSLASIFSSLDAQDVRFFDQLISTLSPGDASFGSLNAAYQSLRRKWPEQDEERDAQLYDSLLSLVKVRGRDWSERWDAVRVGLGLDMQGGGDATSASMTDGSITSRDVYDTDVNEDLQSISDVHTLGGSSSTRSGTLRQGSAQSIDVDSQWTQETSQSEGSDADQSAQSTEDEKIALAKTPLRPRHSASSVGNQSSSSTIRANESDIWTPRSATKRKVPDYAALEAKRDALIKEAGRLAQQAGQTGLTSRTSSPQVHRQSASPLAGSTPLVRRNRPVDQLTQLLSRLQYHDNDTSDDPSQSSSSSAPSSPVRRPPPHVDRESSSAASSAAAQKRIDDMLAALRVGGESLRDTVQRHALESEEAAWSGTTRLADKHYTSHSMSKCWNWWTHVNQRRIDDQERAQAFCHHSILSRCFEEWRSTASRSQSLRKTSQRADQVRSLLHGWRVWKRRYRELKSAKWEARKDKMRDGYAQVKQQRSNKLQLSALQQWGKALANRRAVNFRNGHLLGGAFFLWKIKLDVSHELGDQHAVLVQRVKARLKRDALQTWRRGAKLQSAISSWQEVQDENDLRIAFDTWRKLSTLAPLGQRYETQRVQRSALRTWLQRLSESSVKRRRQGQADRFLDRCNKQRALKKWRASQTRLSQLEQEAHTFRAKSETALLKRSFDHWKVQGRGSLMARVRDGRTQKKLLQKWQRVHKRKTVALPKRAMKIARRHDKKIAGVCLSFWSQRTKLRLEESQQALGIANRNLQKDIFKQWRSASQHRLDQMEQAAAFRDVSLVKHSWDTMRLRIQARRLDVLKRRRSANIVGRCFTHWRARGVQQALDRLNVAQIQSKTTLRMQRQALHHWMQQVIERRGVLIEVGEMYKDKMLVKSLAHWRGRLSRVRNLSQLAQSFTDIADEDVQRKHLHHWLHKYRTLRSLQERSHRFQTSRNQSLQRNTLSKWYDTHRESMLHDTEYTISLQRQESTKHHYLRIWLSKTTHIPALRFHHTKLKFLALQRWKESFPRAISLREGVEYDQRNLTGKAFRFWVEKSKQRRAERAAARFGGPSLTRLRRRSGRLGNPFVVTRKRRVSETIPDLQSDTVRGEESRTPTASKPLMERARSATPALSTPKASRPHGDETSSDLLGPYPSKAGRRPHSEYDYDYSSRTHTASPRPVKGLVSRRIKDLQSRSDHSLMSNQDDTHRRIGHNTLAQSTSTATQDDGITTSGSEAMSESEVESPQTDLSPFVRRLNLQSRSEMNPGRAISEGGGGGAERDAFLQDLRERRRRIMLRRS